MTNSPVESAADVKEKRHPLRVIMRLTIPLAMLAWGIFIIQKNISFYNNSSTATADLVAPAEPVKKHALDGDFVYLYDEYRVYYRFTVDGATYTGRDTVKRLYNSSLTVYYEIGNPRNNRLTMPEYFEGWMWIWAAVFLAIILAPSFWHGPTHV